MHLRDARRLGEDQRRLDILSAWREAPSFFTARERAGLALTESVSVINVWNRMAVTTRQELPSLKKRSSETLDSIPAATRISASVVAGGFVGVFVPGDPVGVLAFLALLGGGVKLDAGHVFTQCPAQTAFVLCMPGQ